MAVCYVRRRMLLLILSTACFLTIGFHTLGSFERNRKSLSEKNNEKLLHRKERKLTKLTKETNNVNNARQLSSYDNSNKGVDGANNRKHYHQQTLAKVIEKNQLPYDIENDDKPFTDCESPGNVDITAYPLVDARTVLCGDTKNIWNKQTTTGDERFRAPGALSPHLVEIMVVKGKETDQIGMIPEMYVFGQSGDYPTRLSDVVVGKDSSLISVRNVSVIGRGKRITKSRRQITIGDDTHDVGQLLFYPPILSHQNILMRFLRTMYKACDLRGAEKQRGYAITITSLSIGRKPIEVPLCIFLGVVAGGIKESYVLGSNNCTEVKLPISIRLCTVKNGIEL